MFGQCTPLDYVNDALKALGLKSLTEEDITAAQAARDGLRYYELCGHGNLYSAAAVDRIESYLATEGNKNLRIHLHKLWKQRGRLHLPGAHDEDFESRVARIKCIQIRIAELTAGDGHDEEMARINAG
ncbi:unnamed protein product [Discula destructiva]